MASGMYLKIDGIKGASTAPRHLGEIEILSWSFSNLQFFESGAAGDLSGDLSTDLRHDFSFSKYSDAVTQALMEACIDGKKFGRAVLTMENLSPSGGVRRTSTFLMLNCTVTSVQTGGDSGRIDQIGLNCEQFSGPAP